MSFVKVICIGLIDSLSMKSYGIREREIVAWWAICIYKLKYATKTGFQCTHMSYSISNLIIFMCPPSIGNKVEFVYFCNKALLFNAWKEKNYSIKFVKNNLS